MRKARNPDSSGYTLLFAMIVASVVLALGVSLLNVSRKEFSLSSSASESSGAFYAADSGLSCAEYWDATSTAFASSSYQANNDTIECSNSQPSPVSLTSSGGSVGSCPAGQTCTFAFIVPYSTNGITNASAEGCEVVSVTKELYTDPKSGRSETLTDIVSRGYNIGWDPKNDSCDGTSPNKLERAIELEY